MPLSIHPHHECGVKNFSKCRAYFEAVILFFASHPAALIRIVFGLVRWLQTRETAASSAKRCRTKFAHLVALRRQGPFTNDVCNGGRDYWPNYDQRKGGCVDLVLSLRLGTDKETGVKYPDNLADIICECPPPRLLWQLEELRRAASRIP